jgi:hypothetical protein
MAIVVYYMCFGMFVLSLNVHDSYVLNFDSFFPHKPAVLVVLGLFLVNSYSSSPNQFYPKVIVWAYDKLTKGLCSLQAFNVIRLMHFYALMFGIWLYRLTYVMFIHDHEQNVERVKHYLA